MGSAAARAAAVAGMDRVEANTDEAVAQALQVAIRRAALDHAEITTDEVWAAMEAMGAPLPHNNSAIGPAMKRAQKDGLIFPTLSRRKSQRESRHCNELRIWVSLVVARPGELAQ